MIKFCRLTITSIFWLSITLYLFLHFLSPVDALTLPKFFGYYWAYENTQSMSSYVNAMILPNTYQLNLVSPNGINGIIEFNYLWNNGVLDSNWQRTFNQSWDGTADNGAYPAMKDRTDVIAGIYVMDEPEMNVNYDDYVTVSNYIKSITHLPIVMVMTYEGPGIMEDASKPHPDVRATWINNQGLLKIPPAVDILGFDEYNCGGSKICFGGLTMTQKWDILSRWAIQTGKKMMQVGDGALLISQMGSTPLATWENSKIIEAQEAIAWCKPKVECNGMIVFHWQHVDWYGSSSLPNLQATFKTLNLAGITPTPTPFPPYALGDLDQNGYVDYRDYVILLDNFGKTPPFNLVGTADLNIFDFNYLVSHLFTFTTYLL
jgi:hypothetical protein